MIIVAIITFPIIAIDVTLYIMSLLMTLLISNRTDCGGRPERGSPDDVPAWTQTGTLTSPLEVSSFIQSHIFWLKRVTFVFFCCIFKCELNPLHSYLHVTPLLLIHSGKCHIV